MMPKKSPTTQTSQMPPKKVYSREFKIETLRLLKSSGKTKADMERELGLYPGQIHLWERAFNKEGSNVEQAFPGTGHRSDAEAELSPLSRGNEILRQEREIQKSNSHLLQDPRPSLKFAFIHRH